MKNDDKDTGNPPIETCQVCGRRGYWYEGLNNWRSWDIDDTVYSYCMAAYCHEKTTVAKG